MTAAEFAARLDRVRRSPTGGYTARCPAHSDRHPSLRFRDGQRGILVTCGAGCDLAGIVTALDLRIGDLFHEQGGRSFNFRRQSTPRGEWSVVWSQTLRYAFEQGRRQEERAPLFFVSDFIRRAHRIAIFARDVATEMGKEDLRTWPLLERAALVEIGGLCAEAELDAIIADGRIDGGGG